MKQILLVFLSWCIALAGKAQVNETEMNLALQLASENRAAIGLTADDLDNLAVTSTYIDKSANDLRMLYLQQTYRGIPVYNQFKILAFRNRQLVSNEGALLKMDKYAAGRSMVPLVTAEAAVQAALSDRKLQPAGPLSPVSKNDNALKAEFFKLNVTQQNITAELMWVPLADGQTVTLAWQVYIVPVATPDYWLVKVNAENGSILEVNNLTVSCNWNNPNHRNMPGHTHETIKNKTTPVPVFFNFREVGANRSSIINNGSYRVIPFPAESPVHPGGAPALVTNPWNPAPGNATTLRWHNNGLFDYTYTRGNNVWAYQDINNNNSGDPARSAHSTTAPDPVTFDFVPNFFVDPTQAAPVQNQQFNITNLFYWNNVIHDLMYQYGFDEASRNFQETNMGRGGSGGDGVQAEAQDGSGINNANFSTPADGGNGRMQMYLWNGSPMPDADVDNGVIVHEYGHGISNRLIGTSATCLFNAEQMGEGWSDYYALMFTQDWANSNLNTGFNSPRGIGNYVNGWPANGPGIRSQRYCTDFAVNNQVYATNIPAGQHARGELWCATLWDMTWNIINQVGSINPNLYNTAGGGGNVIALRLVTEGLKLTQCNPGFISGRNAILAADAALYSGAYACAISEAFRRRGMGANANEGSTNSVSDQTPDFSFSCGNITGSATLCVSGTYSITPAPPGATYNWTVSNSAIAQISGSNTAATVTIVRVNDGTVTLTCVITLPSSATITVNKVITSGKPYMTDATFTKNGQYQPLAIDWYQDGSAANTLCKGVESQVKSYWPTANSVTWSGPGYSHPSVWHDYGFYNKYSTMNLHIYTVPGQGFWSVTGTNGCGSTTYPITFQAMNCTGSNPCTFFTVSPNPVKNGEVIIIAKPAPVECPPIEPRVDKVIIYDESGNLIQSGTGSKSSRSSLRLVTIKKGVFIAEVISGTHREKHKFVVQ